MSDRSRNLCQLISWRGGSSIAGKDNESSFSFLNQRLIKCGDISYDNETNCFTGWNNRNVRL
jgi:hypothetical protein